MEGQDVPRPETVGDVTDSSAEKGLEADRPPGTAQTGRLGNGLPWTAPPMANPREEHIRLAGSSTSPRETRALPTQTSVRTRRPGRAAMRDPIRRHRARLVRTGRETALARDPRFRIRSLHFSSCRLVRWDRSTNPASRRRCGRGAACRATRAPPQSGSLVADGMFASRVPCPGSPGGPGPFVVRDRGVGRRLSVPGASQDRATDPATATQFARDQHGAPVAPH